MPMKMMKSIALFLLAAAAQGAGAITVKHATGGASTAYAEDQLQNAIDDPLTVCGDIIEIDPGAARHYIYPYILRGPALDPALGGPSVAPSYAKDCASSGKYITIRSSQAYQLAPGKRVGPADAANLAFVGNTGEFNELGCTIFRTERAASYWRLQGLEVAPGASDCSAGGKALIMTSYTFTTGASGPGRDDQFPHHITIDQCWLHGIDGYSLRDGMLLDGNMMTVSNSTIENIRTVQDTQQESHAVVLASGRGPVRIVNNKLSSGQIHFISGGEITSTRRGSEYVEFSNNYLYRPFKWLDWSGDTDPTPTSPCPLDSDNHGATYHNTANSTYWECQGASPGTWASIIAGTYAALVAARLPALGKNVVEFKRMTNLHMEGNVTDQAANKNWVGQFSACLSLALLDGPSGRESSLLVENNICRRAGWGFRVSYDLTYKNPDNQTRYWDNGGRAIHNVVLRNNLYQRMGENIYTQPGFGDAEDTTLFSHSTGFAATDNNIQDAVTLDHNTFESRLDGGNFFLNTGMRLDSPFGYDGLVQINQRVTNNIMTVGKRPISGNGVNNQNTVANNWGPYSEITANGFVNNLNTVLDEDSNYGNTDSLKWHCVPGSLGCIYTTSYDTYPPSCLGTGGTTLTPGACKYDVGSNLGFTSFPDDLTLQPGSPFKVAGLDGKDIGADLNTVGWATAGAEAGTMAPYLAMKIRVIVPAATSVAVRFSAIDTSSCTVAARVYGFPLSSPAATATVNTGNLDRTATLTGLTANTHYGLKVTCAGSYYREDEFRTP